MPPELQVLGNGYVRDEFKRHKKCNENEANLFMIEWTNYAVDLSQQMGLGVRGKPQQKIGKHLVEDDLSKFKEDQIVQLYELMKAAKLQDETTEKVDEKEQKNEQKKNPSNSKE